MAVRSVILDYESNFYTVDELTQETYLRAVQAAPTYRGESKPLTWLCGIAKNVARNYIRQLLRSPPVLHENELSVQVEGEEEVPAAYYDAVEAHDPADDPAESVAAENAAEVATSNLPALLADAVELRMSGHSNPEISRIMGISTGYVAVLLSRAKKIYTSL